MNYQQMKTIFKPSLMHNEILFTPHKLVAAINYLTDNKAHGSTYANMPSSETSI
jgi:hypothetical protein